MNRKLTVSRILLASSILAFTSIPFTANLKFNSTAFAQTTETETNNQLFYIYKGQKIPLTQQTDVVAVEFKELPTTRSRSANPLYLRLEKDLQTGTRTRGGSNSQVMVQPLGQNYAVVTLPRNNNSNIQKRIENQSYVKAALPVLSRTNSQDTIVLPNEIVINFKPNISDNQRESILKQNNLEIVRPLRFFPNLYIVKSTAASGTAVLNVANQLNQIQGVNSAAPNFLQSISKFIDIDNQGMGLDTQSIKKQPKLANSGSITKNYLGLQWHLNSVPLQQCLQQQINSFDSLENCLQQQKAKNKQ